MAEDILHRVNRLIRQCKEQAGPAPTTPEDVRRYVALALGVAEPVAEELILEAGSRGANPFGLREASEAAETGLEPVMTRARFELEWVLQQEPGLMTHVTLCDEERTGSFPLAVGVMAVGHGADEADTLLDLWTTLMDRDEPSEAIALVAAAYRRRTGREPERPTS
jgi:hypothetical protein